MYSEITLADAQKGANFPAASAISSSAGPEFEALLKQHKISGPEFQKILGIKGRAPSLTELGVFSAMWSEHCSYKSSRIHLKRFPTTGKNVVVGPGENAGVVRLEGQMCIAFKMESHNHPSYIEPYQGASTGVGGILRDVFCMGARPFANLNCLRFGEKTHPRTPFLVPRAVKGIGDYGNCVGVPTVGGSISYDKSYNGNCLVNAMTLGLIRDDKIFKGFATGIGNLVVYVGSATGRDGIHGATMASDSFAAGAAGATPGASKTTIQVGDPFAEKLLLEATLEVLEKNLVIGIQDMGAAGLTSSSFEMAGRAENGVYFDLDRVPVRAKEMTAYEIMLSESQERMLMVIEPKKWLELKQVLEKWQLAHDIIGVVTNTGRMQVTRNGVLEIDLPVSPLTDDAPVYKRPVAAPVEKTAASPNLNSLKQRLDSDFDFAATMLARALRETGSKQKIYEQFDRHIGTKSVLGPEHGGAAVMWIRSDETKAFPYLGVAIAAGCNERRVKNTPSIGAAEAVLKCVREISAAGGRPLAVTDCLNFGSAEDPSVMREFSDSVDGISNACRQLDVPVVSGNVSLYNSTDGVSIHPTPMIGVVGRVEDIRQVTPAVYGPGRESADIFVLAPHSVAQQLGGHKPARSDKEPNTVSFTASLAAKLDGIECTQGELAEVDWESEKAAFNALEALRAMGCLRVVRSVGEGGAGLGVVKMLADHLAHKPSIKIHMTHATQFFGEGGARYLLILAPDALKKAAVKVTEFGMSLDLVAQITFDNKDKVESYFGTTSTASLNVEYQSAQPIGGLG